MSNINCNNTAIIAKNKTNLLIRCPDLIVDGDVGLDELGDVVKTDLTKYTFIDFCLLNDTSERSTWEAEFVSFCITKQWVDEHFPSDKYPPWFFMKGTWNPKTLYGTQLKASKGSFAWWPLTGVHDPSDKTEAHNAVAPDGWGFSGCVDYLIELFQTKENTAVAFHCMSGADRTGALHAGYLMRTEGLNASDAIKKATSYVKIGAPNSGYTNLLIVYQRWLGGAGERWEAMMGVQR